MIYLKCLKKLMCALWMKNIYKETKHIYSSIVKKKYKLMFLSVKKHKGPLFK